MRDATRNLIRELRDMAASGIDRQEAATRLGLTYSYVVALGRKHVIDFKRKPTRPGPTASRNREIADRYLAGEAQADLAREYGVTRERVRQICDKLGCVEATKKHADFMAIVAGTVARKGLTTDEAMKMFGINRINVYSYCRTHGVKPARMSAEEAAEFEALLLQASTSTSARRAAAGDNVLAAKISLHLKRRGLKSMGRSRWDQFEHRKPLITQWRAEGLEWRECATKLAHHDGKPLSGQALFLWAKRHMPELFETATRSHPQSPSVEMERAG